MKVFGYMDDVIAWQMGLEWYWSWALAIGSIAVLFFMWISFNLWLTLKRGDP